MDPFGNDRRYHDYGSNNEIREVKNRMKDIEDCLTILTTPQMVVDDPKKLRDQFAMAAMHVVGANTAWQKPIDSFEAAQTAYQIADAMMKAREAK